MHAGYQPPSGEVIPPGTVVGQRLVWNGAGWIATAALISGQARLAADVTFAVGVPQVGLVPLVLTIPSGIALATLSIAGRGIGVGVVAWTEYQFLLDGVQIGAFACATNNAAEYGSSVSVRVSGLAAGPHTFAFNGLAVMQTSGVFPVTRPLTDGAIIVVRELEA
jgi:hypothetical protein